MDMFIGQRIKIIMKNEGLKNPGLASIIGVSHTAVADYISGKSSPNYEVVFKIIESFPSYSRDWIITGEGQIKLSSKRKEDKYLEERLEDLENTMKTFLLKADQEPKGIRMGATDKVNSEKQKNQER